MLKRLFHIVLILLLLSACGHRSQEMSEALLRAEEMNRNYQSMDTLKGMEQVADYYRPFLGRSHDADCDFHTLCRIYGQMSVLYQRQRSPRLELEAERKAYGAAMRAKDTIAAVSYYEYMAGAYYALGKKDSALAIVENSISQYAKMKERGLAAAEMGFAADFHINLKSATYRV